jgi:hypothetical protein
MPPRMSPYRLMAWYPYTEQVGVCRHIPRGRFGFACHPSIIRSTAAFISHRFGGGGGGPCTGAPQKLNSCEMSISGHWPGRFCQGSLDVSWTGLM